MGLLCKTSLLYKRIKLRCESLSEIIELILFWKYKNLKNEENSVTSEKTEKNSISFLNSTNSEFKSNCDVNSSKANNVNLSNNTNSYSNSNNETNVLHNSTNNISENFHSKLTNETYSKSKELIENEVTTGTRNEMQEIDYNTTQNRNSECMQMQISEISEEFQKNANENNSESGNDVVRNANNDNCNISIDNTDHMPMPELCLNSNVLTIDINSHGKDLVPNEVTTGSLETNEEAVNYENQIKIVRIEKENQNENHMVDSFSVSLIKFFIKKMMFYNIAKLK